MFVRRNAWTGVQFPSAPPNMILAHILKGFLDDKSGILKFYLLY